MSLPLQVTTGHFLFPDVPALLIQSADGIIALENFATGEKMTLTGTVAQALVTQVRTGVNSSLLTSLAGQEVVQRALECIQGSAVALDGASAVARGGFDTLFLELIGKCNERCLHCYADSGPQVSGQLSFETCTQALQAAKALRFRRVQFTGGEPLLCSFLPDLLAEAERLGLNSEIYTNGTLLRPALFEKLLPYAPAFAFSFYSHDAATHDAITQMPGSHKRTADAIKRAVEGGLSVRVAVVIMAQNASHEQSTREYLRALGAESVSVSRVHEVGRGDFFTSAPSNELAGEDLLEAQVDGERQKEEASPEIASGGHREKASSRPSGTLCVSYLGDVLPCIFNRQDRLGNLSERSLLEIVTRPDLKPGLGPGLSNSLPVAQRLECRECQCTARALQVLRQGVS